MTGFANERLIFEGVEFEVVAPRTDFGPLLPERFGFTPYPAHTGCVQGYRCLYRVDDRGLLLDTLWINHGVQVSRYSGRPLPDMPRLGGVEADLDYAGGDSQEFQGKYANLGLQLDYEGALLIARSDAAPERPLMGCLRPWDFECVWKPSFHAGRLVKTEDVSRHMEMLRMRYGIDGEFFNYDAARDPESYNPYRLKNARRYLARHLGRDLRIT